MFYIRRKDNPLWIKASGNTLAPGGLGEFDQNLYEEVEGPLPQGWQEEPRQLSLGERLQQVFMAQSTAVRAQFYLQQAAVKSALEQEDLAAARLLIESVSVPENLLNLKEQLLQCFPEI